MSGRSTGSDDDAVDRRQVLERLRRDLADDFAGDQRLRAFVPGDPLGDPHHQPAVDRRPAAAARTREHDLLLDLAERHQEQPRVELEARQRARASSRAFSCDARDRIG